MLGRQIFRKESLERLASPDELDRLFTLIGVRAWIPLVTLTALCVAGVSWAILGRVPDTVEGAGVIVNPGRVRGIQTPYGGQMVELLMRPGQIVRKDQPLARINQPDLRQRLNQLRIRLKELQQIDESQTKLETVRLQQELTIRDSQDELLATSINDVKGLTADLSGKTAGLLRLERQRLEKTRGQVRDLGTALAKQLAASKSLAARRIATSDQVLQSQSTVVDSTVQLSNLDMKIAELDLKAIENRDFEVRQKLRLAELGVQRRQLTLRDTQVRQEVSLSRATRQSTLRELQDQIELFETQLVAQGELRSPYTGRILELTSLPGQITQAGARIGAIEISDDASEAEHSAKTLKTIAYFPLKSGKKLREGMSVRITPVTVERERYGSIYGRVTAVSAFPVTEEAALSVVGSPELVRAIAQPGGMIEAEIEMERAETFSGFRWTGAGPPLRFSAGTTASVRVTVEERAPVTYVMPILRSTLTGAQ